MSRLHTAAMIGHACTNSAECHDPNGRCEGVGESRSCGCSENFLPDAKDKVCRGQYINVIIHYVKGLFEDAMAPEVLVHISDVTKKRGSNMCYNIWHSKSPSYH